LCRICPQVHEPGARDPGPQVHKGLDQREPFALRSTVQIRRLKGYIEDPRCIDWPAAAQAQFLSDAPGASLEQLGQGAMVYRKLWGQGQNGEGTMVNSPRRSLLSGRRWIGQATQTPSSKQRWMEVALLDVPLEMVQGETGAVWHNEASRLVHWAREAVE
jgi:hypothetical protein